MHQKSSLSLPPLPLAHRAVDAVLGLVSAILVAAVLPFESELHWFPFLLLLLAATGPYYLIEHRAEKRPQYSPPQMAGIYPIAGLAAGVVLLAWQGKPNVLFWTFVTFAMMLYAAPWVILRHDPDYTDLKKDPEKEPPPATPLEYERHRYLHEKRHRISVWAVYVMVVQLAFVLLIFSHDPYGIFADVPEGYHYGFLGIFSSAPIVVGRILHREDGPSLVTSLGIMFLVVVPSFMVLLVNSSLSAHFLAPIFGALIALPYAWWYSKRVPKSPHPQPPAVPVPSSPPPEIDLEQTR